MRRCMSPLGMQHALQRQLLAMCWNYFRPAETAPGQLPVLQQQWFLHPTCTCRTSARSVWHGAVPTNRWAEQSVRQYSSFGWHIPSPISQGSETALGIQAQSRGSGAYRRGQQDCSILALVVAEDGLAHCVLVDVAGQDGCISIGLHPPLHIQKRDWLQVLQSYSAELSATKVTLAEVATALIQTAF